MPNNVDITGELQRHPMSHAYPEMSDEEFDALFRSISNHGFDSNFPILLYEGQIIDGWNRYRAALKARVTPIAQTWEGDPEKIRDFIIYANSTRRHLSAAAHAQALIRMREVGSELSDKQIMAVSGVSASTLAQQKRLREKSSKVADEVAAGETAAAAAVRTVLRPPPPEKRRAQIGAGGWSGTLSITLSKKMYDVAQECGETVKRFVIRSVEERIERLSS